MIISKTPFRISFVGGGTDFRDFYIKNAPGMVVSSAINKYIYVSVHKRFEGNIRLSYSKTELVDDVSQIKHELIKEAMKMTGVNSAVEITITADVPGKGTGLGSSSSLTVGLLNALYVFKGEKKTAEELARDACKIEIEILKGPIGKQDQYIAAFGGLRFIKFLGNDQILVENINMPNQKKKEFDSNLFLFYTGKTRKSEDILVEQKSNIEKKTETLIKMRDMAKIAKECLNKCEINKMGELLHQNWQEKKQLAGTISDEIIDDYYSKAIQAGALGGKVCGAGGGGFMLFYCQKENSEKLKQALAGLQELPFNLESSGSRIIYNDQS